MWLAPRETVRRIIDAEERPSWYPVVALASMSQGLLWLQGNPRVVLEGSAAAAAGMALFFGALMLVYSVIVGPFLLAIVGGWLGGEGDASDVRQAIAWSLVPQAAAVIVWIVMLAVFGRLVFTPDPPVYTAPSFLAIAVLGVWTFVLQVAVLSAALRFSIWRALLLIVIFSIPVILL